MASQLDALRQLPAPAGERDLLNRVFSLIERRLPPEWSAALRVDVGLGGAHRADGLIELTAPGGPRAQLIVEVKNSLAARDLPRIEQQLAEYVHLVPGAAPLVVTRYLPPSARERLEARGISYADATGNLWLSVRRPALFLRDVGADHDPWRGPGRPLGTLKGPPAARVVRALIDYSAPATVPELVRRSGASTGATYRVVDFLQGEELVERESRGVVAAPDWRRLLERWSRDYGFQAGNHVTAFLQPRGEKALLERLRQVDSQRYAVTGSLAARNWAPFAPAKLAMIYVEEPHEVAAQLDLREVDAGANVLLASASASVVFDRTTTVGGVTYVAQSQAAVDLLTAPGRGPAEAQELLDWMEKHERDWRRR